MNGKGGIDRSLSSLMERATVALEKMAEDPVVDLEVGLPVCPYCEKINPEITVQEETTVGPLLEFLLYPRCNHCGESFYAVPVDWRMFKARAEVEQEMKMRSEAFSGDNGTNG